MSNSLPVLIIDKKGILGSLIAQKISKRDLIILVSKLVPEENSNIVHIPFRGLTPQVPDNTYSKLLIIDDKSFTTKDSIDSFLKKAKSDSSEIYFITSLGQPLQNIEQKLNSYQKAKLVLLGEIFDDKYNIEENTLTRFIDQIRKRGEIEIPGDGTEVSYPVSLADVVEGLSNLIYENLDKKIICFFPKNPITHLSLAHLFQKQNPLIKIDFKKGPVAKNSFLSPLDGHFYLGESIEVGDHIKNLDLVSKKEFTKTEIVRKPYFLRRTFLSLLFTVLFILLLPLISTLSFSLLGASQLNGVKRNISSGNLQQARENAQLASTFFKVGVYSSNVLSAEAGIVGQQNKVENIKAQIASFYLIAQAASYISDSALELNSIFNKQSYSKEDFSSAVALLKSSVAKFRELEATNSLPAKYKEQFMKYSPIVDLLDDSIDHLPNALGFEGNKKYLLLFLNNMELRPGGGFIGSYATLNIHNARVTDFRIYDVYDADGQLKEHLEPPFAIRRYLPSAHFYLRDSDFYFNFSDNALSAENFLALEKKEKFDGVIAVDVSMTKSILEVLGGVNVSDYNEVVTSDNFFDLANKHSSDSFFPGSTQKKDFLTAVFRSIQADLSSKKLPYLGLAQALADGILEKHVQLYFNDPSLEATAIVNGMSPGIIDTRKDNNTTINDFTGVAESNLGVNKVNSRIARTINKTSEIKEEKFSSSINISFKNDSDKDNYKNYIRFITPLGSKLESIKINGAEQDISEAVTDPGIYESKNFKPPPGLEVTTEIQSGKTVYGFLVTIPKNNIKTVNLTYSLNNKLDLSSSVNYSLKFIKQPGTEDYPFSLQINYPQSLKYINSNNSMKVADGSLSYETELVKDLDLNIKLASK